jgi:hypothetical protein
MKTNWRRIFIAGGVLVIAGWLAYTFSDVVREDVVLPLAYRLWFLVQAYRAVPQQVYWAILLIALLYFIVSIVYGTSLIGPQEEQRSVPRGQVEQLAEAIEHRGKGIYFKWRIANLLAEIAAYILNYQERRSPGRKLSGRDWNPPPAVNTYLDAGINTTFADYPSPGLFKPRPVTPFDIDIEPVVDFLESELEMNQHDDKHP